MTQARLVRTRGGLACLAAGLLLPVGHLADLGGDPDDGTVPGAGLVLAVHALLVFGLVAVSAARADRGAP